MAHVHVLADLPTNLMLTDGGRAFITVIDGVTPVNASHLATKGYVDSVASSDASKIRGRDVSTDTPTDGDVIYWDDASSSFKYREIGSVSDGWHFLPEVGAWYDTTESAFTPGSGAANGNPRKRRSVIPPGATATNGTACTLQVPVGFAPGTALSVRIRYIINAAAFVSSTLDCEVYHSHDGKSDGSLTDLIAVAAVNINGTVATWIDRTWALTSTTAIGPGDIITVRLKHVGNDTGGAGGQNLDIVGGWLIVGDTYWRVGQRSLVGSSLIIG